MWINSFGYSVFIIFPFTLGLVASSIITGYYFNLDPLLSLLLLTTLFFIFCKQQPDTIGNHIHISSDVILLLLVSLIFLSLIGGKFVLSPIISTWDGIVSFQRWAYELSTNDFTPYGSFYQVGWPAIWSLFADAEMYLSTQFSKIFLIFEKLTFIFLLASYSQAKIYRLTISIIFILSLLLINQTWLFSGNIDSSLSFNVVNVVLCCAFAIHNNSNSLRVTVYINAAVCFFFFSILIKQQIIYVTPILVYSLWKNNNYKLIDIRTILFCLVCLTGLIFNYILYLKNRPNEVFDYYSMFLDRSIERSGPEFIGMLNYAFNKTYDLFINLGNILLLSIIFWLRIIKKKKNNIFSNSFIFDFIILLVISVGFCAYSYLFAYDNRGALWMASLLSTLIFINCVRLDYNFDKKNYINQLIDVRLNHFQLLVVSLSIIFSSILINSESSKKLVSSFGLTGEKGAMLLSEYINKSGNECLYIINRDQIIKYNSLLIREKNKINNFNPINTLAWNEERIIKFIKENENNDNFQNLYCGYLIYTVNHDNYEQLFNRFELLNPAKNIFIYRFSNDKKN